MVFGISKLAKPFKRAAKRLKKVAGKVMGKVMKLPGFKQLGKLYGKTFGKLGPLGMIAASMVIPGAWAMMSNSLAGSSIGWLKAVGGAMQNISTTLGGIGNTISGKIDAAMESSKELFQEASNFVTGGGNPADFTVSGAEGLTRTQSFARPSGFGVKQKPFDIGAVTQRDLKTFDINNLPRVQDATAPGGSLLTKPAAGVDTTFSGVEGLTRTQSAVAPEVAAGEFNAKKLLKAGMAALGGSSMEQPEPDAFITGLPVMGDDFAANRLGVAGAGSAGGQFLTQQQQAFFSQHASLLGQVG